jgi:class 3 adenylate cyclase
LGLPRSNIRHLIALALLAGAGLGALISGLVRLAAGLPPLGTLPELLFTLLSGLLISLALIVAIRLSLRHAAHDLLDTAHDLTDATLPTALARDGDALAALRTTLSAAVAAVPSAATLVQLAEELGAVDNAATALDRAATQLARHIPIQGAILLAVDAEHGALRPVAVWGIASLAPGLSLDLDQTTIGRALRDRREADYSGPQVRELLPLQRGAEALSLFCLPQLAGEHIFGMLCLLAPGHQARLSAEQRAFARAVTSLLTLAEQNSVQRQYLAREHERLVAFEQLGALLAGSQRIERALEHVLSVAARVTDSAHGSLLLLEPDERSVRFRITLREGDLLPLSLTVAPILKHGLAGWALRERRADLIEDTDRDQRWLPMPGLDQMRAAIVVPLLYGERALGVLTLADPRPHHYSRRSLALATALATYAVTILARMQYDDLATPGHATLARQLFEDRIAPASLATLLGDDVALAWALAPQSREVVAIAVGLRGLDRLGEQLPAAQISEQVLAPYHAALTTIAHEHQAYLAWRDEAGFWLIFGFPEPSTETRTQALRAAQAVQITARRLRGRWRSQLRHDLALSAGVAAGSILIAPVGAGPSRTLALVGSTLREAARIQRIARTDEVLVDATLVGPDGASTSSALEALSPLDGAHAGAQRPIFRLTSGAS